MYIAVHMPIHVCRCLFMHMLTCLCVLMRACLFMFVCCVGICEVYVCMCIYLCVACMFSDLKVNFEVLHSMHHHVINVLICELSLVNKV